MNVNPPAPVVVGIVADERHNGVTGVVKEKFYVPHSQWHVVTGGNLIRNAFVVVRAPGDPMAVAGPVRQEIRELDAALPVANIRPMTRRRRHRAGHAAAHRLPARHVRGDRARRWPWSGSTACSSYLVARRTHEIGIRLAIGADRGQVLGMIVRHGVALAAIGIVIGLVGGAVG